jgi:hypothetical protein
MVLTCSARRVKYYYLVGKQSGRAYVLTDVQSRQEHLMASGATAVTCLIKREAEGRRTLYAANVGDRYAPAIERQGRS